MVLVHVRVAVHAVTLRSVAGTIAAGALAIALAVSSPLAAQAVPGGVEVSFDGVHFGSSASGPLFTSVSRLVPGEADQSEFYFRNSSSEPGFLRITLRDVATNDSDLANALTLSASTFGNPGAAATLLEANPCRVLLEGQTVAPGEVVRVVTTLALAQLNGKAGQNATATAGLSVALSGTEAALPPTDCGPTGTVLPVVPGQNPAGTQPGGSATTNPAGTETPGDEGLVSQPQPDLPVLSPPGLLGIDPNTWHLLEEYLILVPIGASIVGGIVFGIVAWRRRNGEDQLEASA